MPLKKCFSFEAKAHASCLQSKMKAAVTKQGTSYFFCMKKDIVPGVVPILICPCEKSVPQII